MALMELRRETNCRKNAKCYGEGVLLLGWSREECRLSGLPLASPKVV